jgi:diaminohydroxyphosphoribosylaminopyrimidine deaminase/5-amino-6-(5-phosphoribosylamino)uracil reductase
MVDEIDRRMMRRALLLAARGRGRTSPNPMVGAVLVRDGSIVGEGFHPYVGGPHAEVVALQAAGERASGATLYVTLEPCCHTGRTPPCTEAILRAGVARVTAAAGKGFARLREGGLAVEVGVVEAEARALNAPFFTWVTQGRPLGILKAGMSLDGRIATRTGDAHWITGPAARRRAHAMRAEVDAILVGAETALRDNPQLTARDVAARKQPLRVVADSRARLPLGHHLARGAREVPTLLATTVHAPADRVAALRALGVEVLVVEGPGPHVNLKALAALLAKRDVASMLIEGGGTLHAAALAAGIVDRVALFVAPLLLGGRDAVPVIAGLGAATLGEAWRLTDVTVERVGQEDWLVTGSLPLPERRPPDPATA